MGVARWTYLHMFALILDPFPLRGCSDILNSVKFDDMCVVILHLSLPKNHRNTTSMAV